LVTDGQFVFCPPGTPAYPHPHLLFSFAWTRESTGDWEETALGPVPGITGWYTGAAPDPGPALRPAGDPVQLRDGARYPADIAAAVISGYPGGCWPVPVQGSPIWLTIPDYTDRATWAVLAQLIDLGYDNPAAAVTYAGQLTGGTATVVGEDSDWMPRTFYATNGRWNLVFLPGTTSELQLALQALSAGLGPVQLGDVRVLLIHWQAAQVALDRLIALGLDPSLPTLFAGHSYGGAMALLLAHRLSAVPGRTIHLVTFGMPKPGDEQSGLAFAQLRGVHLVNAGDPVPDLPPDTAILSAVPFAVPPPFLGSWPQWAPVPSFRVRLEVSGRAVYSQDPAAGWLDYFGLMAEAIAGDPLSLVDAHGIKQYLLRLETSPP